ncbi:MAG: hypothetical protein JWM86_2002 [Thermoleophilia bacterium]|nr:hypothetical protein [Thermoleophilia bacterium]
MHHEHGLTLVEVLVVMVIIAVLSGISVASIQSSRASGRLSATTTSGFAYANAIDEFARDHNGRYPAGVGTADWARAAERGPVSTQLGGDAHPYLRSVPEPVQDGRVSFDAAGPARLQYRSVSGGRGYELIVTVQDRDPCAIRGGESAGTTPRTCARR